MDILRKVALAAILFPCVYLFAQDNSLLIRLHSVNSPEPVRWERNIYFPDEEARYNALLSNQARAEKALFKGKIVQAYTIITNADYVYPKHPASQRILGDIYFKRGEYYKALSYYSKGVRADNSYIPNYIGLSKTYEALHMNRRAMKSLILAYNANDKTKASAKALYMAAKLALRKEGYSSAKYYIDRILSDRDTRESAYAYLAKGDSSYIKREYSNALYNYNYAYTLLTIESNKLFTNASNKYILSKHYQNMNELNELKIKSLGTKYSWLISEADSALQEKSYHKAAEYANEAIKIDKTRYDAFERIAKARFRLESYNLAWEFFNEAQSRNHEEAAPYIYKAQTMMMQGEELKAIDILNEGIQNAYFSKDVYVELASSLAWHNSFYYAAAVFNNVFRFTNISAEDYAEYAKILVGKEEYSRALEYIKAAQRTAKGDKQYLYRIETRINRLKKIKTARIYIEDGNVQNAYDILSEDYFSAGLEQLRIFYLSRLMYENGMKEKALNMLDAEMLSRNISLMNCRLYEELLRGELERRPSDISVKNSLKENTEMKSMLMTNANAIHAYLRHLLFDDKPAKAKAFLEKLDPPKGFDSAKAFSLVYFEIAFRFYLDNRLNKAKAYFARALEYSPLMLDARYFLNELSAEDIVPMIAEHEDERNYEAAAALNAQLLKLIPYRLKYLTPLAYNYFKAGHNDKALELSDKIKRLSPSSSSGYELAGDIYFNQKKYFEAIVEYNEAAALSPRDSGIHIKTGKCYFELDQYETALKFFKRIIDEEKNAENCFYYATANYYMKNYDIALKYAETAAKLDPMNEYYHINKGIIEFDAGKTKESLISFERSLEINEDLARVKFYKARSLFYLNRYDEALPIVTGLIKKEPKDPLLRYALGAIYMKKAKSKFSTNYGGLLNEAIIQFKNCVSNCQPLRDDSLKGKALAYINSLRPNFHIIAEQQLAASPSGNILQDEQNPNLIYVPLTNGYVTALDLSDNSERWRTALDSPVVSALQSAVGHIMCSSLRGILYVINAENGEIVFSFKSSGKVYSSPTPVIEQLEWRKVVNTMIFTSTDGRVYNIEYKPELRRFEKTFIQHEQPFISGASFSEGRLFLSTQRGILKCVKAKTGDVIWERDLGGAVRHKPLIVNEIQPPSVFAASDNGYVYKINKESGEILADYKYKHSGVRSILYAKGHIFFGDDFGRMHVFDADLNNRGYEQVNGAVSSIPVFVKDFIIFASENAYLYLKTLQKGQEVYKIPVNGAVRSSPVVLDDNLIAVLSDKGTLYKIAVRELMEDEKVSKLNDNKITGEYEDE